MLLCYKMSSKSLFLTFQNHNLPHEQHCMCFWKDKNHKYGQKAGTKLHGSFLIMSKMLIIFIWQIFGLKYKCLKWSKILELNPFNGYRWNLMLIVNAKNSFGAKLGKKFINLEPDSV